MSSSKVICPLTSRQCCDLEMLGNGSFAPLEEFMSRADYESVCERMRLANGTLWPIPIVLDVTHDRAERIEIGAEVELVDPLGIRRGSMVVREKWAPDLSAEARAVCGTADPHHPEVARILCRASNVCIAGPITFGERIPFHLDFPQLRLTPAQVTDAIVSRGWERTVGFQTRNPLHRAHFALTRAAMDELDAGLLLHPAVGETRPGDIDYVVRTRCYLKTVPYYPEGRVILSLLPLSMRMVGPREALLDAIVRRNFGCTHLIVGRDHAGPGSSPSGEPYYREREAQELVHAHRAEIGIEPICFEEFAYDADKRSFTQRSSIDERHRRTLSGTELRVRLETGDPLPEWFTFPEVAEELARCYPPLIERGLVIFFTGLSASGKSTAAQLLRTVLGAVDRRKITVLDGDEVRRLLSSELGFSVEHRNLNIRRIGFVAGEVAKHGGIALCAAIAPLDASRKEARKMVEDAGGTFVLVHLDASLDCCEQRDPKGMYRRARAGEIPDFTGISSPYEPPRDAELVIDTSAAPPDEVVHRIIRFLRNERLAGLEDPGDAAHTVS